MRNGYRSVSFLFSTLLLISLACNLVGGVPAATTPTSKTYAIAITAGGTHACALLNNGKAMCWGSNSSGQLGVNDGSYKNHTSATLVSSLDNIMAISAGGEYTCALINGGLKCWGDNISGQLGDGTKTPRFTPVEVQGLTSEVLAVSAGGEHACALINNGNIKCWGKNLYGRGGNGSYTRLIVTPTDVVDLTESIKVVSAGQEHTCAITSQNTLKCWGANSSGQLGIGNDSTAMTNKPMDVTNLSEVIAISSGFQKTCAATKSGSVKCWGWSGLQQFDNNPTDVAGITGNAIAVTAGGQHSCALTVDGAVQCWGANEDGQLGNGNNSDSYSAVSVKGLPTTAIAISANYSYTCALLSSGEVWCWGSNSSGQLGNGTTESSAIPVKVIGLIQ